MSQTQPDPIESLLDSVTEESAEAIARRAGRGDAAVTWQRIAAYASGARGKQLAGSADAATAAAVEALIMQAVTRIRNGLDEASATVRGWTAAKYPTPPESAALLLRSLERDIFLGKFLAGQHEEPRRAALRYLEHVAHGTLSLPT